MRIPRDWFGPKDELVPFGPRAWESPDADSSDAPEAVGNGTTAAAEALDASLFWGGDTEAVHDFLDPPAEAGRVRRKRTLPLVAAALAVVALAGTALSLLGGSQPRPLPRAATAVASRSGTEPQLAIRGIPKWVVRHPRAAKRAVKKEHRSPKPASSPTTTTQVTYRPYEASSSATSVSYSTSRPSNTSTVNTSAAVESPHAGSTAPAAVATAQPTAQSSQPAFGSGGALGPMSSPDG